MAKGIIVVDVPERCNQCKFWFGRATIPAEYMCMGAQKEITDKNLTEKKPDWCPICPIPEKRVETFDGIRKAQGYDEKVSAGVKLALNVGWNNCIDEMLKDGE